jgi:DNA-binding CsgD family transcriptional regulator
VVDDVGLGPSFGGGREGPGGENWPALWFARDDAARLVASRRLVILAANRPALDLLDGGAVVSIRDGALVARDRRSLAELTLIIAEASLGARVGVVGAAGDGALLVDAFALGEETDSPVAMVLRDVRADVEIECADLESMFGVTPGEHLVIVELLKGHSSREIADASAKSILTIRTHVKRAYGKIGVKTRGQLFAKLLPYLSIRSAR